MNKNTQPIVKVVLSTPAEEGEEELCCGPGMISILEAIHKTGSVRRACARISISYSKAWKLLSTLEKWLGFSVTIRQQGGEGGGQTVISQDGLQFMKKHRKFLRDCQKAVEAVYSRYYG
jgi:molybdate transport system regulatory protein